MDIVILALTVIAALGCGVMAGLFFTFSNNVMKALSRIDTPAGIAAMQQINIVIINPVFMLFFMGTAALCAALAIVSAINWDAPGTHFTLNGTGAYLLGAFLITIVFNVPLNNVLAKADPTSEEGAALWAKYLRRWTAWNHLRTLSCMAASVLLTLAAVRL